MNHHRYPYRSKLSPLFREIDDTCPLMNFYPIICYIYWNKGMQKEFYSIYLCSRYVHTHRYFQLRFNIREIDDTLRDTCPLMDRLLYVRYTGTKEMQKEFHSIYLCSRCIHTHRYFQLRFNIREIDDTLMNFDPIVCYIYNILEQRKCKKSSIRSIFVRDAFIPIATFNFVSIFEESTIH